ncbi:aminoglycoside phosphotransferase family protein [Kribbella yunnanensis]|uniref:Aminoglycoside phosphotransferase family protein n=1 Tax=Kribbella yunnanensis TaxID=190194 RepID=A0ABN2J765_9ACTN
MTSLSAGERARLFDGLSSICLAAGIDPSDATLLRYTMNAVFRLEHAGVVVRMAPIINSDVVDRVAKVATAFGQLGLPTARLAPGLSQPVAGGSWIATVWTLLPQVRGRRHDPADLAGPLRAIHALPEIDVELPGWDPLGQISDLLSKAASLTGADDDFLSDWATREFGLSIGQVLEHLWDKCGELAVDLEAVEWTLPRSVIHGDAHAGNLLDDLSGRVVIGDLDSVSIGPPEWDLIPAAHGALRFGDDPAQHRAFAQAYGLDVSACPAWDVLRQVRELQLVTSVIPDLRGRPGVASELARRLASTLTGAVGESWNRYT